MIWQRITDHEEYPLQDTYPAQMEEALTRFVMPRFFFCSMNCLRDILYYSGVNEKLGKDDEMFTRGTALTAPTMLEDSQSAMMEPPAYTNTVVLFSTLSHCTYYQWVLIVHIGMIKLENDRPENLRTPFSKRHDRWYNDSISAQSCSLKHTWAVDDETCASGISLPGSDA